jgi:hypothetical protein
VAAVDCPAGGDAVRPVEPGFDVGPITGAWKTWRLDHDGQLRPPTTPLAIPGAPPLPDGSLVIHNGVVAGWLGADCLRGPLRLGQLVDENEHGDPPAERCSCGWGAADTLSAAVERTVGNPPDAAVTGVALAGRVIATGVPGRVRAQLIRVVAPLLACDATSAVRAADTYGIAIEHVRVVPDLWAVLRGKEGA